MRLKVLGRVSREKALERLREHAPRFNLDAMVRFLS